MLDRSHASLLPASSYLLPPVPPRARPRYPRASVRRTVCARQCSRYYLGARLRYVLETAVRVSRYAHEARTIPRWPTCSLDTRLIDWLRTVRTPVPRTLGRPHFASTIDSASVDLPVALLSKSRQNTAAPSYRRPRHPFREP